MRCRGGVAAGAQECDDLLRAQQGCAGGRGLGSCCCCSCCVPHAMDHHSAGQKIGVGVVDRNSEDMALYFKLSQNLENKGSGAGPGHF